MTSDNPPQAIIAGFLRGGPKLCGVLFAGLPLPAIIIYLTTTWSNKQGKLSGPIETRAASLSEQIIYSIRVVTSFGCGSQLIRKLDTAVLQLLRQMARRTSLAQAINYAAVLPTMATFDAFLFWWGAKRVAIGLETGDFAVVSAQEFGPTASPDLEVIILSGISILVSGLHLLCRTSSPPLWSS